VNEDSSKADGVGWIVDGPKLVLFDFNGVFVDNTVYAFEEGREALRRSRAECRQGCDDRVVALRRSAGCGGSRPPR
jgi:hypothetical protein